MTLSSPALYRNFLKALRRWPNDARRLSNRNLKDLVRSRIVSEFRSDAPGKMTLEEAALQLNYLQKIVNNTASRAYPRSESLNSLSKPKPEYVRLLFSDAQKLAHSKVEGVITRALKTVWGIVARKDRTKNSQT